MVTVKVRDENGFGHIYKELALSFEQVQISAKDLIVERVYQEVFRFNQNTSSHNDLLVSPTQSEKQLNHDLFRSHKVDPEIQVELALKGFESNAFFVLVDDKQIEDLEQVINISTDTSISFVKLVQLVGG